MGNSLFAAVSRTSMETPIGLRRPLMARGLLLFAAATCVAIAACDGAAAPSSSPDAALPDAALPDAASPDAALPDAALPDAALPDADAAPSRSSDPNVLLSKVIVDRVDLDFGVTEGPDVPSLWDRYANQPYHEQFTAITTENWYANWQLYKARILSLADARGFDDESLARCFQRIEPAEDADVAFLPIGASLARRGNEPVWIIVVNWEWSPMSSNFGESETPQISRMSHIRAWALTARDCEQIDSMTCG
jgi:hypothetical protein